MKLSRLAAVLITALAAVSSMAIADDAEIAAKLKGNWQGYWQFGERIGRMSARVTGAEETRLQGEVIWFGMAPQALKLPFDKAEIKDGAFKLIHDYGLTIDGKVSADGKSIKGTWGSAVGGGPVELKKGN